MKIVIRFDEDEDPVPVSIELASCPTCGKKFKGLAGVEIHMGLVHKVS